ncbi:MAG: hypothetical protein ACTSRX_07770 [Promethearchaeota archaeon]
MTNIGLLGAVSVGKTTILRLFVKYLKTNKIDGVQGGKSCTVVKTDFSGEAVLDPETGIKETKTIHPNRVVFRENELKRNHTLFAPGGDRGRAVVRMGVITISRIAKQIIFPKQIYVCFNKIDLIAENLRVQTVESMKAEVIEFFAKRNIVVKEFYTVSAESVGGMESFNDKAAEMILYIATS